MIGLVRSIVALAAIFLPTALNAQNQMVEISNLQLANSVFATVQDQTGHPVPGVAIEEYDAGWKQPLRSTTSDGTGKFSFAPVTGRKIYYLQLSARGLNPLRVRIRLVHRHRPTLRLQITVAT
jgi:hypothetical protein